MLVRQKNVTYGRCPLDFEVWPEAIELGRLFAEQGYELALVGGPVRDLLLHRKSHDLDFCSSARPEQFEPILRRWGHDGFWDMGRKFGTLGAMRRRATAPRSRLR